MPAGVTHHKDLHCHHGHLTVYAEGKRGALRGHAAHTRAFNPLCITAQGMRDMWSALPLREGADLSHAALLGSRPVVGHRHGPGLGRGHTLDVRLIRHHSKPSRSDATPSVQATGAKARPFQKMKVLLLCSFTAASTVARSAARCSEQPHTDNA